MSQLNGNDITIRPSHLKICKIKNNKKKTMSDVFRHKLT